MRKYFLYLIIYSIGGFILERILNVIVLGYYYDNSVLIGPYQPLYGTGVLLAILVYDFFLRFIDRPFLRHGLLLIVAIIATSISEAVTGYGMEYLYGVRLWDYKSYFPLSIQYVGLIPTSLFGIINYLVIVFIHPWIKLFISSIPGILRRNLFRVTLVIFVCDVIYTMVFRLSMI